MKPRAAGNENEAPELRHPAGEKSSKGLARRSFLKRLGGTAAITFLSSFAQAKEKAVTLEATKKPPRTGLLYHPVYKEHLTGAGHPESPARLDAITEALGADDLKGRLLKLKARPCTDEEILTCHTEAYLEIVKRETESGASELSTGDTAICERSLEAARLAVGGVLVAVDAVVEGLAKNAFCAVRPPGHHATANRGMGFCIFNNVAIAARYGQKKHRLGKVLIVDWDVHHGNGTQAIFYEDAAVFYFSTHQWPWYPGTGSKQETGRGKGKGTTLNCPFQAGAGRKEIVGAFKDELVPAADAFRPDLVLISAGFDSRKGDPLGGFNLSDEDFAELTRIMLAVARKHARGRLVSTLEGGYNLPGLASATKAHVKALAEA